MRRDVETRIHTAPLELRKDGDGKEHMVGYAAVFNARSVDLGGFVEIIRPGAFKRTLASRPDVTANLNHNDDMILGRTTAGTLALTEDEHGLRVDILPPPTQAGRDVTENVRLGNYGAMSFAFQSDPHTEVWDSKAKPPLRELHDVDLFDVAVVAWPAYPQTEVGLRSLQRALAQIVGAEMDALFRRRRLELLELELGLPRPKA